MKKLALKLDDLNVQSFATTDGAQHMRGTVRGHLDDDSYDDFCSEAETQIYTCDSCDPACEPPEGPEQQRRVILY
ncbi:MAG TPA: pinensin family lanthipeptide [Longimicrobium sp.]